MRIGNLDGTTTATEPKKMLHGNDFISKTIQSQIQNLQEKRQKLADDSDMSIDEKMKKKQEIQQEISNLNNQLREHLREQRKKLQESKNNSMDDVVGERQKTDRKDNNTQSSGLSQASMKAIISADSTLKQAVVQDGVVTRMEGKAAVLESEIKNDKNRGYSAVEKESELANVKNKITKATASYVKILGDANDSIIKVSETNLKNKADSQVADVKKTDEEDKSMTSQISKRVQSTTPVATTINSYPEVYVSINILI